jgi:hypothetical protein
VHEAACSDASCPQTDIELRLRALRAAKAAKVTVLVLGLTHNAKNNDDAGGQAPSTHENEGSDRRSIALPPGQLSLARTLAQDRSVRGSPRPTGKHAPPN